MTAHRMLRDVVVRASGRYVPERVFTNDEFTSFIDTSDEWITERTGIKERRFAHQVRRSATWAARRPGNASPGPGWTQGMST